MTGSAVSAAMTTTAGTAVASTALGAAVVVTAPVAVGFAAACAVCSLIGGLFDD